MTKNELLTELFDLHKVLFQFAVHNATGGTRMPLFSIQAPGHIGVDYINAMNPRIRFESLPDDLKERLRKAFSCLTPHAKYPLVRTQAKQGLIDCFLEGLRQNYLMSVTVNPLNHYAAFLALAETHAREIVEWLENGTKSRSMRLFIQPEIRIGSFQALGDWVYKKISLPELCFEAYRGFQPGHDVAEQVFGGSFFCRAMDTLPPKGDEILTEADIFVLALWLALGNIYRVHDVRFERGPWRFSPDEASFFGSDSGVNREQCMDFFQLQSFVRFNAHKLASPSTALNESFFDRIITWMKILSDNRDAVYRFVMIRDGIRDSARSIGEQSFRRTGLARDGIYGMISGLEGLSSECRSLSLKGATTAPMDTFAVCWGAIWQKALGIDPSNPVLSKAASIDSALKEIYALRSHLAHSDPALLSNSLSKVKKSCGDLYNPGHCDPGSVGITVGMIIDELLEFFLKNGAVLKDMLNGTQPE